MEKEILKKLETDEDTKEAFKKYIKKEEQENNPTQKKKKTDFLSREKFLNYTNSKDTANSERYTKFRLHEGKNKS
jgi:hypothetical protein